MIDLLALNLNCAPNIHPQTVLAIQHVESQFNPNAIHINHKNLRLKRQPANQQEAVLWSTWLMNKGYSIDMGLMQINSSHLNKQHWTVQQIFEPCFNLKAASQILTENYQRALNVEPNPQTALLLALSAYQTGNFHKGFQTGYVGKVINAAQLMQNNPQMNPREKLK